MLCYLILKQIYVNERAYRQQSMVNSYYVPAGPASSAAPQAFKDIWIEIPATAKYSYAIVATPNTFTATATGNIPNIKNRELLQIAP